MADVHDSSVDDHRVMDTALDPGSESVMADILDDTFDDRLVDDPVTERTNLALPLSSFVGRAAEVAALGAELRSQRLLTITGSGGCGKTRLAYEVAWAELDGCPDGVWCVELAPVSDTERVAAELAQVLGVREEFGRPIIDTLADRLRQFDGLVVLDNCEHVLGGVRPLVEQLLRRCPTLHVLTTSREPLGVTGETTWRVPSLDRDAGVELFVQRAHSARPDFDPSDDELAAIARIVDRLDGIPLAVELAAARVRMMSPTGIESALEDRFRLLTGGSRTSLARQQTLEASVAWSYDLLDPDEQAVARRLAVMSDFTLDAAEAVAADDRDDTVLDLLTHLVDKSIVRADHTMAVTRYRFLESIRQYLHGRLVETGEVERVRARHLAYFLSLVESVEPEIAFADSARLLAMLELEHDNLEAALDFADATGRREDVLRLAASMTLFWELRGHLGRGSRWLARLLDETDDEPSVWRGRACWGAAHIGLYGGDVETMSVRAPQALELAERFDDDWTRARALNTIGFATAIMDPAQARPGLERSVELGLRIGDDWAVLNSSKMMTAAGWAAQDEALVMADLEILRNRAAPLGATYFLAWYHGLLGYFLTRRGELASARRELDIAIEMCDEIGEPVTGSMSKAWRWAIDVMEGDVELAGRESAALLERASASGGGLAIADLLANLGRIAIARATPRRRSDCWRRRTTSSASTGSPSSSPRWACRWLPRFASPVTSLEPVHCSTTSPDWLPGSATTGSAPSSTSNGRAWRSPATTSRRPTAAPTPRWQRSFGSAAAPTSSLRSSNSVASPRHSTAAPRPSGASGRRRRHGPRSAWPRRLPSRARSHGGGRRSWSRSVPTPSRSTGQKVLRSGSTGRSSTCRVPAVNASVRTRGGRASRPPSVGSSSWSPRG